MSKEISRRHFLRGLGKGAAAALVVSLPSQISPPIVQASQNTSEGVDFAMENAQACTYQKDDKWIVDHSFETANVGTVASEPSRSLAMFNTDLPGVSGPPKIGVSYEIPALEPGEKYLIENEIVLTYNCDGEVCLQTTTASFSVNQAGYQELRYDNNVEIFETKICNPPAVEKKVHLPLVLNNSSNQ